MFRLIRLAILLCAAFAGGVLYERLQAGDRCAARGGTVQAGVCLGSQP